MRIRRIEISAFRCFRGHILIDTIDDGITLLVGDNEEGKSTVLAALQTVLFEKHTVGGAVAAAMLPYGSKVRPEIGLDFDHDGVHYRLSKAFCQKPMAELEAETGTRWGGDAAEDQLRDMLEFTPQLRGGVKPEHRGLQSLFWVEQGLAFIQPQINDTSHISLTGALEAEIGTVTGGERGRTLIKRVESRVGEMFTPKTRKPAGAYKDAIDQATKALVRRDEIAASLKKFEDKVDTLTEERQRLAQLEVDDPIGTAEKRLTGAQEAVRNIAGFENQLQTAEAKRKTTQSEYELAKTRLERRQESRKEIEHADRTVEELKGENLQAQEAVNDTQAIHNTAAATHQEAKVDLDSKRKSAAAARRLRNSIRKSEELIETRERFKKAQAADEDATTLMAKAEGSAFTSTAIEELRRSEIEAREESARLNVIATLLELTPDEGRTATIQGEAIEADALTLTEPTDIDLHGYGTIRVTPGGEDLSIRRATAAAAASKLQLALDSYGIASVQVAAAHANDRETWRTEAAIHRTTAEAHAPEGLDALRNHVATLQAAVDSFREDVNAADIRKMTSVEAAHRADDLGRTLSEVEVVERSASDTLKDAEGALQAAKHSLAAVTVQRETAEKKSNDLRQALDKSVTAYTDEHLVQALRKSTEAQQATQEAVDGLNEALSESDPAGTRRELEAANEARIKVEDNLREKRRQIDDLTIELRTLGKDDAAGEMEIAAGELVRAENLKARLSHQADALTLLLDTLVEEEQIARETFLAPVRDRVEPYLKRLLPKSALMLDDQTLRITHLRREGMDEPYERLSIGTREQLAVLVRLAFADLLDEHGKKSPIILDDALVFSDDQRFEKMQRILDRAAERLQIIVLTCHERAYFDRGWTTKRLQGSQGQV